ncbi:MAG: histidine kinase dimerization/phospho-acceptor domain-containing protein, partial [Planctomycetota bacterium]
MRERIHIKRGIRWKLLTTMIGLIVGLLLTFTFLQISTQKDILEKELERRICLMKKNLVEQGALLSDNLARQTEEGIASFNFSHATEIIKKTVSDHEELSYIILMDSSCVAHTHTLQPELQQERLTADEDTFASVQDKAVINEYEKGGKQFMEMIVPLNVGTGKWGALRLGFSLDVLHKEIELSNKEIRKKIQEIIIRSIITAVLFIIIGAVVVYMISTKLSRPLIKLTESARLLAKGDFAISANIKVNSRDEVGMLAESFTEMAGNLKTSYEKLEEYSRTLEQKVEERTSALREANEKLKELDKIKSDFLSTVSHELRTPLTSVLGFTKIIKKRFEEVIVPQIKTEDGKTLKAMRQIGENVGIIISEGERLTSLINDVLDITKIEAGKVEWKMEPLLMSDIIGQATAATLSLFEQKGLKLIKYVEDNLPVINGDKHRLMQVVINLISNAVKFTDEGIVTCAVKKTGNDVT